MHTELAKREYKFPFFPSFLQHTSQIYLPVHQDLECILVHRFHVENEPANQNDQDVVAKYQRETFVWLVMQFKNGSDHYFSYFLTIRGTTSKPIIPSLNPISIISLQVCRNDSTIDNRIRRTKCDINL